jgi:hypothetical protein
MTLDWPSLLLGIFLGGIIMWGVDWFFYGQVNDRGYKLWQRTQEKLAAAQTQLEETEKKLVTSEALRQTADADLVQARADAKEAGLKLTTLQTQTSSSTPANPANPEA